MNLGDMELGLWAGRFLERSASTLTKLDVRCLCAGESLIGSQSSRGGKRGGSK
jgi:hypothetical protein